MPEKPAAAQMPDEEVLKLSLQNPASFKLILDRYEAAFLRRARMILGDREEARDVVVETFTKIYLKGNKFRPQPGASFKSWAYKILTNTAFSYYKKLKREQVYRVELSEVAWAGVGAKGSANQLADLGWKDLVHSTLARLPLAPRRILSLYYLDGLSQLEIAALEGLSVAAVKTRVHRAKKEFKKLCASA